MMGLAELLESEDDETRQLKEDFYF